MIRRGGLGLFSAGLVAVGGLGLAAPDVGSTSTAPAYDIFHLGFGALGLALAGRGRPAEVRTFLVGFALIDLYQALASHNHWFPEASFRWTSTDDHLHLAIGVALLVAGAWPGRGHVTAGGR